MKDREAFEQRKKDILMGLDFQEKWFDYRMEKISEEEWRAYVDTVPREWLDKKQIKVRRRVEKGFQ